MSSLVLHENDPHWRFSFEAVKADPDNFDLWEQLVESTERVQRAACAVLEPVLQSVQDTKSNTGSNSTTSLANKGLPAGIPSGPSHSVNNNNGNSTNNHHSSNKTHKRKGDKNMFNEDDQSASSSTPLNWDPVKEKSLPREYVAIKTVTREVYDMFLERFPLLFGYWTKYAEWENVFANELKQLYGPNFVNGVTNSDANTDGQSIKKEEDTDISSNQNTKNGSEDEFEKWNRFLNIPQNALAIHERSVTAFPMSIDLWTGYTLFLVSGLADRISTFMNPPVSNETQDSQKQQEQSTQQNDLPVTKQDIEKQAFFVRSVFERAAAKVGRDFLSDPFWDAYLEFEEKYVAYLKPYASKSVPNSSDESGSSDPPGSSTHQVLALPTKRIVHILSRVVRIPLHQYARYYERFVTEASKLFLEIEAKHQQDKNKPVAKSDGQETAMENIQLSDKEASNTLRPSEVEYIKKKKNGISGTQSDTNETTSISAQMVLDYFANVIFVRTQAGTTDRWAYESLISRPYFHVLDLEQEQIDNWNAYLSWEQGEFQRIRSLYYETHKNQALEDTDNKPSEDIEMKDDTEASNNEWEFVDEGLVREAFQQVQTLYERALIPCAFYDSVWLRYSRWLHSEALLVAVNADKHLEQNGATNKNGTANGQVSDTSSIHQQLIQETRNTYRRACCIYVPVSRPFIRFQYSLFEESLGDVDRARDILLALQEATCAAVAVSQGESVEIPSVEESISVSTAGDSEKKDRLDRGKSLQKVLAAISAEEYEDIIKEDQDEQEEKEKEAEQQNDDEIVDVRTSDILSVAAQTSHENQKEKSTQATSATTALPAIISKMLSSIDTTEPFFYRVEFERRVNGPLAAFNYLSQLLGDSSEPRQTQVVEIYKAMGFGDDEETENKKSNTDLSPSLLKSGISPIIKTFLVSIRAELVSNAYKLYTTHNDNDNNNINSSKDTFALQLIQTFAQCVSISRSYYKEYLDSTITNTTSSSTQTAGPAVSLPKFWVSYFEFEKNVVCQLARMRNEHVVYFDQLASGKMTTLLSQESAPSSSALAKKRKRGAEAASTAASNEGLVMDKELLELSTDATTVSCILCDYVKQHLDALVDSILQEAGIPQSVVIDLVRTYVDDVLTMVLGKKSSFLPHVTTSFFNSSTDVDISQSTITQSLRQLLLMGPQPNSVTTKSVSRLSTWVSQRAAELEIELNGPISTCTKFLTKISDDGNPESAKAMLRIAVGGY